MQKYLVTITKTGYNSKPDDRAGFRMQTANFKHAHLPIKHIAQLVGNHGYAFYGAMFGGGSFSHDWHTIGKTEAWRSTSMVGFDFDNKPHLGTVGMSIAEACAIADKSDELDLLFAYYTFSHTAEHPHFRLVCKVHDAPIWSDKKPWLAKLKQINKDLFREASDKHALSPIKRWQGAKEGLYYVK